MAEFKMDKKSLIQFYNLVDEALEAGAIQLQTEAKKLVPRDWKRPPKPIDVKGTKKDYYRRINGVKRKLPMKNGQYFAPVTGMLSRSIKYSKVTNLEFVVGILKGSPAEKYAPTQEFGDKMRNIPERSFLRKALEDKSTFIVGIVKEFLKLKLQ